MKGRNAGRLWLSALLFAAHAAAGPIASAVDAASIATVGQVVMGILGYSRWPVQPKPIRLCIVGQTAYAGELLDGRSRPPALAVQARRADAASATLAQDCDAVYLGGQQEKERRQILRQVVGHPVVSIVEDDPDCAVGSMFCLDIRPEGVGFQVNLDSVARSGVRINPGVLQLSRRRPST
jgi:hypothetical protein